MDRSSAILERLLTLHPREIDLSLERVERLMADLGHPERRLPPVIHVAGTNGKGSTIAFMRAILEAAGLRVHVYTSPHLVRFNERFRLAAAVSISNTVIGSAPLARSHSSRTAASASSLTRRPPPAWPIRKRSLKETRCGEV